MEDRQKEKIVGDAKRLADDVMRYVGGGEEKMSPQEKWMRSKEQGREKWEEMRRMMEVKRKKVDDFAHKRVWETVGIGALLGFLIGVMLGKAKERRR